MTKRYPIRRGFPKHIFPVIRNEFAIWRLRRELDSGIDWRFVLMWAGVAVAVAAFWLAVCYLIARSVG